MLPLGGDGKKRVIFSSTVMLLVLFGCGRDGIPDPALFGGGGRGGSCPGLPGFDMRIDLRLTKEPPDLLRR
jgi:hypothetical protein